MPKIFAVALALLTLAFVSGCGSTNPPGTPTGLAVTSTAPVTLSWNTVSGASSYIVYRGTAAGISSKTLLAAGISTASYADSTAIAGTTYYYQVTAFNDDGQSTPSTDVSAVGTFTLITLSKVLGWDTVTTAVNYNVYRSTASDLSNKTQVATGITAVTFTDTTAAAGTSYYYQIAAVDASSAEFVLSNIVSVSY